jgi:hypothetical protein
MKKKSSHNVAAIAGIVASGYGYFHSTEPVNYVCWALVFLYCYLKQ